MRKLRVTTALVAFAGLSGAGFTAPAYAQDSFNWTGPYIGANAGYGWGDTDWSDIVVPSNAGQNLSGTFSSSNFSGIVGGLQAGYNIQFGQFVAGVETAFDFGDLKGSDGCFGRLGDFSADCKTDVRWMWDLTARLGVVPMDRALLYVKGGASIAGLKFSPDNETGFAATGGYGSTTDSRWGYVLGIGAAYALNSNLTVGVEYNYRDYGTSSTDFNPTGLKNQYNPPFKADTKVKVNTVVATVNYKF